MDDYTYDTHDAEDYDINWEYPMPTDDELHSIIRKMEYTS